jgi:hypothetical protein
VHGDIEHADGDGMFPNVFENFPEALSKDIATKGDPDKGNFRGLFIALGNFVGDAGQGAANRGGIEDDGRFRHGGRQ